MEIQLQELIDQIKKDGVEAAETQAAKILATAKAEAEKIVADARAEAEKILATAKNEQERAVKSGEDAISQAGRNLLLSFRESVTRELEALLKANVSAVYSSEALAQIIVSTVQAWANKPDAEDLAVIVSSEQLTQLEDTVLAGLRQKLLEGVTLKASDRFDGGFRIAVNNGSAYYDYSSESVVDMLANYLSPRVAQLMKEA